MEVSTDGPFMDRFPEEQATSDQEDAGIHNRANDGRKNDSGVLVPVGDGLEHKTGTKAAERSLDQNRNDGTEGVDCEEGSRITGEEDHNAVDKAKPGPVWDAEQGRADDDWNQCEVDGEDAEFNGCAEELEDDDDRRQHRGKGQHANLFRASDSCFHSYAFLLLFRPDVGYSAAI